jgi:hypothetical protein
MCEELKEFKSVVVGVEGGKEVTAINKQKLVEILKKTMKRMQNELVQKIKSSAEEDWDHSHIEAMIWEAAGGSDTKSNSFKNALEDVKK